MGINLNIFSKITGSKKTAQDKLNDFMLHIRETPPDLDTLHQMDQSFQDALQEVPGYTSYKEEKESPVLNDNEEVLFVYRKNYQRDGDGKVSTVLKLIRVLVCLLVIILGFAMIILPSSQGFEMYTLIYFNEQDGFTLMDLISLIIIFAGIYALVSTFGKRSNS